METCKHVKKLIAYLSKHKLRVWSEFSEEPYGWVDVSCGECHITYQVLLKEENNNERL